MDAPLSGPPLTDDEVATLFAGLEDAPALLLAVSGGPDSTALLVLAARWRRSRARGPELVAVTVDHGLRPESKREAAQVKALARALDVPHRTVRWIGEKPRSRLQARARAARYALLAREAKRVGAHDVLTAHTLDDQAETVLFRLARGSGLAGLGGMARVAPLPQGPTAARADAVRVVRPFLSVPKARLIATLRAQGVPFSDDPSNRDPRFARVRLRQIAPRLADEGLDARRLAALAERARRADAALAWATAQAEETAAEVRGGETVIRRAAFVGWPLELRVRVLARAVGRHGSEGPAELGKLEALAAALSAAAGQGRRTLAGALVTLAKDRITVAPAPPRRHAAPK